MMAGRGSGKTRTAAEWCLDRSVEYSERGVEHRGALIGPTVDTTRDVMVLGESGMLACAERRGIPTEYLPTNRLLLFPTLNSRWQTYSAEKPDQLRGPAHHTAWLEEIASWRFLADAKGNSALMNTDLGLRLQPDPRMILTTTPKPIEPIRDLVRDAEAGARGVVLTRGSTFENARNLAPQFIEAILARYEGTRLGAQEIHGILLDNVEGALWTVDMIEAGRVGEYPDLERIIVAVDPPAETAECGIVVVGSEHETDRLRGHAYVLDDTSLAATPELWGRTVVDTYRKWDADAVVAEVNQGGDMVRAIIHAVDPGVPVKPVRAAIGKAPRAEPVVALYEQCVAEGSPVETERGPVLIEEVTVGDRVWTRAGLRRVQWCAQTGIQATVVVGTDDGRRLCCTPDHPVYVVGRGFVSAGQLVPRTDRVLAWSASTAVQGSTVVANGVSRVPLGIAGPILAYLNGPSWCLPAPVTTSKTTATTGLVDTPAITYSTEPYGKKPTDRSPTAGTYTTATAIRATTTSPTWSPSTPPITLVSILANDHPTCTGADRSETAGPVGSAGTVQASMR